MGNEGYSISIRLVDSFFVFPLKKSFYFCMYDIPWSLHSAVRAHRFEELCHGKNPGNLVPTKLINGCLPELRHKLFLAVIGCGARLSSS